MTFKLKGFKRQMHKKKVTKFSLLHSPFQCPDATRGGGCVTALKTAV